LQQDFFFSVVSFGNIPMQYLGVSVVFKLQQDFFLTQFLVVSLGLFKDRRVSNKIVFIINLFF